MHILLLAAMALGVVLLVLVLRERRLRTRRDLLRQILDLADALEGELRECRARLHEVPTSAASEPAHDESVPAPASIDSMIDAGLRDLLAHRLWLQREGAQAPAQALVSARDALAAARQRLQAQLARLADARADLNDVFEALATTRSVPRP